MDIAIVGVVALIITDGKNMEKIRIALGSVGATVLLAKNAQSILEGKTYSDHRVETAAKIAAEKDASYIDDVRSSAKYREKITTIAVQIAVKEAWNMAKGGKR
jgi:carbon-monoxide dehydrogenase medium subunit